MFIELPQWELQLKVSRIKVVSSVLALWRCPEDNQMKKKKNGIRNLEGNKLSSSRLTNKKLECKSGI